MAYNYIQLNGISDYIFSYTYIGKLPKVTIFVKRPFIAHDEIAKKASIPSFLYLPKTTGQNFFNPSFLSMFFL